ncbi:MAG: CBS domain-containing protein [Bacillota bacterium]|nr:CBS domain-containing protein [Bacillota bacterium]
MFKHIPKISYSLLASFNRGENLTEAVSSVSNIGIDMIHYDVSEMERTLSFDDLPGLMQHTHLPFDVHLSVKNPDGYISKAAMRREDFFCIHVENRYSVPELRKAKSVLGCNFGLAINTETPVKLLFEVANEIDYVLFMGATPGVSGEGFSENVVDKIQIFKKKYPDIRIHVDGGINNMTAALLRDVGVDVLISGSYILKDNDYSKQVAKLVGQNLNLPVREMMRRNEDLPVVSEDSLVNLVAREIDDKRIGCTCVLDSNQKFAGLITDTDIRRTLIQKIDLTNIRARDIMNPRPYTCSPDTSLIKLLRSIEEMGLYFTVVPVVAEDGTCVGVLRLQDVLFSNVLGLRIRQW